MYTQTLDCSRPLLLLSERMGRGLTLASNADFGFDTMLLDFEERPNGLLVAVDRPRGLAFSPCWFSAIGFLRTFS